MVVECQYVMLGADEFAGCSAKFEFGPRCEAVELDPHNCTEAAPLEAKYSAHVPACA